MNGFMEEDGIFWAFWVDMNLQELHLLLKKAIPHKDKDKTKDHAFKDLWKSMIRGETGRSLNTNVSSSWKTNYLLTISHLNLWDNNGVLTRDGYKLVDIGDNYGVSSREFRNTAAKIFLINGNHIRLLKIIWEVELSSFVKGKPILKKDDYIEKVSSRLLEMGHGRSKKALNQYLSHYPSLWGNNNLKILKQKSKYRYFFKKLGYIPDWPHIVEIVQESNIY